MEFNVVKSEGIQDERVRGGSLALSSDASAFIEQFLAECDVAPSSKVTYRKALKQFFIWYKSKGLNGITRSDVLAFKQEQLNRIQATTVASYMAALRAFFRWLESEKLHPNVTASVKGVKLSQGHRKDALTPSQANYILKTLREKGSDPIAKRDYALFNLLLHTGLRTIEVHRADIGDIRSRGAQSVLYVQGKGRLAKDEFVVLTDAALQPIYDYLSTRDRRGKDEPLFASMSTRTSGGRLSLRSIREITKEAMRGAGFDDERLTSHSLRHTAITLALLGGASLQQAQQLARHSNINTTLLYSHNLSRVADAAEFNISKMLDSD